MTSDRNAPNRRERLQHPLDEVPSIKLKLGFVIAAAVAVTVFVFWLGLKAGLWPSVSGVIAAAVAMAMVWFLSRGMTSPLREMAAAASEMARGNYDRRVSTSSRDEVGELARAFNRMAAELAETDRVRRDLVANVSHELRTPITALQVQLENLVDGVSEPDPDTFATMLAQVERLGRLVKQLLDLSRLESGAVPLERTEFAVEPLLQHAVREQQLHDAGVDVSVAVDTPGLVADGDPERMHQVVANLLENAVRHTPRGGRVEVRAHRTESGPAPGAAPGVTIEVLDEGPGIAEADRERVFERFYRADSARASRDGGAGLGLAIARWIVGLHGGDIHPEHRDPHGCRMVVTLPDPSDHSPVHQPTHQPTHPSTNQEPRSHR
jgi:signal transduction histidine kinase